MIFNPSSGPEKKHKTPEFLLLNVFYDFLKKELIFHISDIFENNHLHIFPTIIVCVSFYVNMLDQTQYSLISPFLQLFFQYWCPLVVLS